MNQNDIVRANADNKKVSFESCVKIATDQRAEIPFRQSSDLRPVSENSRLRSLPFGVDTSIEAAETHACENLILYDSEICDYSDRLLVL